MKLKFFTYIFVVALGSLSLVRAAEPTIADRLNSEGTIAVVQPDALNARLRPLSPDSIVAETGVDKNSIPKIKTGFRVQVFDDNNVRSAKHDAQACKQTIAARFPEFPIYVTFSSPYWRVKVGDFRTRAEAESAMAEIKAAFPSMAKSLRIVRDRIQQR